jgi:hypothetical protein
MRSCSKRLSTILLAATMLTCVAATVQVAPAFGSDFETYLAAPVWYLEFEVGFKTSSADTTRNGAATIATSISMDRSFSAMWPLDVRLDGPSTVLNASYLSGAADGKVPSAAEQMKALQGRMARMSTAANWMSGGGAMSLGEDATFEESQAAAKAAMDAAMGPVRMDYLRVDVGTDFFNELGERYDMTVRTTRKGSGSVYPGGGQSITFEIDAAAKKYALVLPMSFNDMGATMTRETLRSIQSKGGAPDETRDSTEQGFGSFPSDLTVDEPANMQAAMVIVRGDVDPASGTIAGERSMGAHYTEGDGKPVAGTLTLRYKLSMTRPAGPKSKG